VHTSRALAWGYILKMKTTSDFRLQTSEVLRCAKTMNFFLKVMTNKNFISIQAKYYDLIMVSDSFHQPRPGSAIKPADQDRLFGIVSRSILFNWSAGLFAFAAITYAAFQKKLLPKPISAVVSRIFFLPTLPITALLRLGNYWTPIDDTLMLGCAPVAILGHPEKLHKLGVRGVINMCYEYDGPKDSYALLGMKQLHLPTVDHFEPSVTYLNEAVAFIEDCKSKGEKVYVHCKAGHGRAASVALCWMIRQNPSMAPKDVNSLLREKRKVRKTLYEQKNIREFCNGLSDKKKLAK
jgi:atypical dual specificity phosphatase